jgi:hypothetical protein
VRLDAVRASVSLEIERGPHLIARVSGCQAAPGSERARAGKRTKLGESRGGSLFVRQIYLWGTLALRRRKGVEAMACHGFPEERTAKLTC